MLRFTALALLFSSALAFAETAPNSLTPEEKAAGWQLLFDGTSTKGWRALSKPEFPTEGWSVKDGTLFLAKGPGGGDIVTEEQFTDYEFTWEWNIAEGANSGVKYNLPDPKKAVGCEYQLLDDEKHPDGKAHGTTRQTGGLYDVLSPSTDKKTNPPGQWNQSRIIVKGNKVEHYLNGAKTVEYEFGSDALNEAIAKSKFKNTKGWGAKVTSPLLLQDHNDQVMFRNLKLRKLLPE